MAKDYDSAAITAIRDSIINALKKYKNKLSFDITQKARITKVSEDNKGYFFTVTVKGMTFENVRDAIGLSSYYLSVGKWVWVTAPCGDMNKLFISGKVIE